MPDVNGVETLKKMRGFGNKTKIIMLTSITGAASEKIEKEARLSGAAGFLRKNLGMLDENDCFYVPYVP